MADRVGIGYSLVRIGVCVLVPSRLRRRGEDDGWIGEVGDEG